MCFLPVFYVYMFANASFCIAAPASKLALVYAQSRFFSAFMVKDKILW